MSTFPSHQRSKHLVTGAGGFIGHHLVNFLKTRGNYVVGIDLKYPEYEPTRADHFAIEDIRCPSPSWTELFDGVTVVWALAADMGGMGYISGHHAEIMRNNVLININTLEAARQKRVGQFFFTSSACVYPEHIQENTNARPLAEPQAYPANPQDGYGWEKLYSEKLCEYYRSAYGLDTRIVRFHNIYGPMGTWRGGREKAPAALCRKVAEAVAFNKDFIEIWGDGEQTRSFCYVDDCIQGLWLLLESGYRGPTNLGSDEQVTLNVLADKIISLAKARLKKVHVDGPQGVRGRNSDNTLLQKLTGWSPPTRLDAGLKSTYEWISDQIAKNIFEPSAQAPRP